MAGNPFGAPGTAHAIEYWADKADGRGVQRYRHVFNAAGRPVLDFTGRLHDLVFRGGKYAYQESGQKIWLTNPPRSPSVSMRGTHKGAIPMAKRKIGTRAGRLSGRVTFVHGKPVFHVSRKSDYAPGHRGVVVNPPLMTTHATVWGGRVVSVAAGGVIYFGGDALLHKYAPTWTSDNPKTATGVLVGAGVLAGAGAAAITRDIWAGVGAAALPVVMGGIRIYRHFSAAAALKLPSPPAGGVRGIGQGDDESIGQDDEGMSAVGQDVYDDHSGIYLGRVIGEVTDDAGRVIGHLLDDGQTERVVSGGEVISQVPIGYDGGDEGLARIPVSVDEGVSRIPVSVDEGVSRIPVAVEESE